MRACFIAVAVIVLITVSSSATVERSSTRLQYETAGLRVVAFGDSITGTGVVAPGGWAAEYARLIGATELTNLAQNGSFTHEMLEALRTDPRVREAIASADVIVMNAGMNEFFTGRDLYSRGPEECGGPDGDECLRIMLSRFEKNWNAIAQEIGRLAPRTPVIALNLYHPLEALDQHFGWAEGIRPYLMQMNQRVASTPGIRLVDVYVAFNGESGMDDPIAKGYILPDAIHATPIGHAVILEMVRSLGVPGPSTRHDRRSCRPKQAHGEALWGGGLLAPKGAVCLAHSASRLSRKRRLPA